MGVGFLFRYGLGLLISGGLTALSSEGKYGAGFAMGGFLCVIFCLGYVLCGVI